MTDHLGSIRDYNFEGRHDRIRYDTPRLGPVVLSVSAGHDSASGGHDSILQFGMKSGLRVPGGRMLVGLGYSIATQTSDDPSALSFEKRRCCLLLPLQEGLFLYWRQ